MTTKTATKTAASKKASAAAPKAAPAAKTFSLADLARDLKVNPKIARAKARRNSGDFNKLRAKGDDHWVFPLKNRDAVSRLLTGAAA